MIERTKPLPPFYDLPRYCADFLETLFAPRPDTEPVQREISTTEAMSLLSGGCLLAEETDPGYMYECWFLSRTGKFVRFVGVGQGHLYAVPKDTAEAMLANLLTVGELDDLRTHDLITSNLV